MTTQKNIKIAASRPFSTLSWIHLFLVILALISPFLFNYMLVFIIAACYYLQLIIFKNCVLTTFDFGERIRNTSYIWFVLKKLHFSFKKEPVRFVADFIIPPILVLTSIFIQTILEFQPLLI